MLKENETKICNIIIDTYENEAKYQDKNFDEFCIFVSTIESYGFEQKEVKGFAQKFNIEIIENDKDPDDEFDAGEGSLVINKQIVKNLKEVK